jgi:hypothetical protein
LGELHRYRRGSGTGGFDQNIGIAGVIYILSNDGFRDGYYKIGCSRRSGRARAFDLNVDANTGTPGSFRCVFEQRTVDCGRAERLVFERLRKYRRGKPGQEFFEVELDLARQTILSVCADVDSTRTPPTSAPRLPIAPSARQEGRTAYTPPAAATSTTVMPPQEGHSRSRATWLIGLVVLPLLILWVQEQGAKSTPVSPSISATSPLATPPKPAEHQLSRDELDSIEAVCSDAMQVRGPAAYRKCTQEHRRSLVGSELPSLAALDRKEFALVQAACWNAKNKVGPKAYGDCLREYLRPPEVNHSPAIKTAWR